MKNVVAILAIAGLLWFGLGGAVPHVPIPAIVHEEPLIAGDGLHVLIVHEADDDRKLPIPQGNILISQILRDYVSQHSGEIRVWDKDADVKPSESKWEKAFKEQPKSLPWLVASGPGGNLSEPLPATLDATIADLDKKCVQ